MPHGRIGGSRGQRGVRDLGKCLHTVVIAVTRVMGEYAEAHFARIRECLDLKAWRHCGAIYSPGERQLVLSFIYLVPDTLMGLTRMRDS
jgi:hypothetical protein